MRLLSCCSFVFVLRHFLHQTIDKIGVDGNSDGDGDVFYVNSHIYTFTHLYDN